MPLADRRLHDCTSETANPGGQLIRRRKTTMRIYDNDHRNEFGENVIHLGVGFAAKERSHVIETLSTLGPHLGKWDPRDVDLEVSLQDRGGKEQRVTLRTILPGRPPL